MPLMLRYTSPLMMLLLLANIVVDGNHHEVVDDDDDDDVVVNNTRRLEKNTLPATIVADRLAIVTENAAIDFSNGWTDRNTSTFI